MARLRIPGVGPDTPFGDLLCRLALARLDEMMRHYSGTRAGDAEALHDMRVASRRLESALLLGRGFLAAPRRYRRHERWIEGLTDALGRVRDLDVLLAYLAEDRAAAPTADLPHLERLAAHVDGRRAERRDEMETSLTDFGKAAKVVRFEAYFGADLPPAEG